MMAMLFVLGGGAEGLDGIHRTSKERLYLVSTRLARLAGLPVYALGGRLHMYSYACILRERLLY